MATIFDFMMNSSSKHSPAKIKTTKPSSSAKILTPQLSGNMGKQIVENMESVIKSLKKRKKHKKHKQKKAIKALELNSEDESLAKIKENWIRTRPKDNTTKEDNKNTMTSPFTDPNSDKKNAFQMLMLNGKGKDDSPTQEEGNKKVSPDFGKRKPTPALKNQNSAKRRKLKNAPGEEVVDGTPTEPSQSPKSPNKKRRKKKLFECRVETIEMKRPVTEDSPMVIVDSGNEDIITPSRPRRSCATNVTYVETSPISSKKGITAVATPTTERTKKKTATVETIKTIEPSKIESIPVIDLELKSPEVKKLAPLFMKAVPKPTIDPKILEARQSFLKSELPEKLRQEIEKKKSVQEEINHRQLNLFPEISHVTQAVDNIYLQLFDENKLFPKKEDDEVPTPTTYCIPKSPEEIIDDLTTVLSPIKSETKKKDLVRSLKANNDSEFPAYLFYKMLVKKAKSSIDSDALCVEKFKPSSSKEFISNISVVKELKEYLADFITSSENGNYDTDDEGSMSTDAFGMVSKPTMVLSGPCSTGKTSAVYAIANELNYNVIEINASSKRNGSRMLQQLLEATQSHKVPTAKMALNKKILRRLEREEKKMSIIFIEDVDVIFTEDNGFLAAITQLMSMTKRPIILTTNNRNSSNLKKTFEGNQYFKFLEFQRSNNVEDCVQYLYLLGLVQGANVSLGYLQLMFEFVDRDIRQAMFQLDFITRTKEIPAKWSLSISQRVALPYFSYETKDDGDQDDLDELTRTIDSLCVADTWTRYPEMDDELREMYSMGKNILLRTYEEASYEEMDSIYAHPISNFLFKNPSRAPSSTAMDVEPMLRLICTSECARKETQRSTSKFSHYLLREPSPEYCLSMFGSDRTVKEDIEFLNQSCNVFK